MQQIAKSGYSKHFKQTFEGTELETDITIVYKKKTLVTKEKTINQINFWLEC